MDILSRLSKRIHVLDGAMGTMVMAAKPEENDFRGEILREHPVALKGCNDILVLTRPVLIEGIHTSYLEAGADIISTDSFNANRLSLAEYRLADRVQEICHAAAAVARKAVEDFCRRNNIPADERPLVAGSMGPTGKSLSISMQDSSDPASDFDEMAEAYKEQAEALIKGGVDLLLLETAFDTLNVKAAIYGIKKGFRNLGKEVPVMLSATLTENGRLLSGQSLQQFVEAVAHIRPISIGLNCGFGAEALMPYVETLASLPSLSDTLISLHPNAGLPDALGNYLDTPERMAEEIKPILANGFVNIIGGCCGTTPAHISRIAEISRSFSPRILTESNPSTATGFLKVGERCNVAGSRKFLRLVSENNWKECLDIAAGQVEKGAAVLDINMDDAMLDAEASMRAFIPRLGSDRRTSDMPLMIDSSDFNVISRTLRLLPLKGIVNSISLKNGEEVFLDHAREINALGCAMVVMAFDEKGQADTFSRRVEICSRAYRLLTDKAGISPENIIFDPNVLAVATGIPAHDRYALDFIRTTEWIKSNLPGAKVSGGVSNLSFSFRGIDPVRKAMHTIFLDWNIKKGMDMAIINPATPLSSETIDPELHSLISDLFLCSREDASDRLLEYAMKLKKRLDEEKALKKQKVAGNEPAKEVLFQPVSASFSDRLAESVVEGDRSSLDSLIEGALTEQEGSAMRVVEKALMKGMDTVGVRFGRGDMFLPQVVRSASVMKAAVDILTPLIESQQAEMPESELSVSKRPTIVLATVKGDVHDIGKNIVAVVLRCGGFEVVDLGVMTPPEKIIETAVNHNADAIGLSGLITPSLQEMSRVAEMMEKAGLKIPLFVGGATTSALHTAVKIAPLYSGPVVRTADAASLPPAIRMFINPEGNLEAILTLNKEQDELRLQHAAPSSVVPLSDARKNGKKVAEAAPKPLQTGKHSLEIPLADLEPLINWRAFLAEWKINPAHVKGCGCKDCLPSSEEAETLLKDARKLLGSLQGSATAKVIIEGAKSSGDDIILADGLTIPTLRSLTPNPVKGVTLAMSDFVAEADDHVGLFAVTLAASGVPEEIERLKEKDPYQSLLLQSLSHRLAEAATEWTHRYVRKQLWGVAEDQGIRPAVGYASLPDQSLVFLLDKALDYTQMGIQVTEHGALYPSATTTGLIIAHPSSRYFEVGQITKEAFTDYASRRGLSEEELQKFLNI